MAIVGREGEGPMQSVPAAAPTLAAADRLPPRMVTLTDADRFPFSATDLNRLTSARLSVAQVQGHDPADVVAAGSETDVMFVYSASITEEVLERFTSCRLIVRCGSGYDRIDVAAARARGIEVSYVPDYGSWDVAEHALALMFAVARRLIWLDRAVHDGAWPGYPQIGSIHRLRGATLGLLGFGRIAQCLASVAATLGMTVSAYDPYAPSETFIRHDVQSVNLTDLAETADVVSLHAPLTPATSRIIDSTFLNRLKATAILINTSRGELVDEAALAVAVSSGRLAGAGLDVLANEPAPPHHSLLALPTVLVTPHTAALTDEALTALRSAAIDEVLRFTSGRLLLHPVPPCSNKENS